MEELNEKFIFTFDIKTILQFIILNHKQLILFFLVFIIIYLIDYITYHNSLIYGSAIPGIISPPLIKKNKNKNKK
jgi:hypothetical protein